MSATAATLPANVILVGFMGCGKTTIGRLVARRLEWGFVDTDARLTQIVGCDIPTLFARDGEASFRERESAVLLGLTAGERQVIATGGGAVLREDNIRAIRGAGTVIWLTARPEVIAERVTRRPGARPLLASAPDPLARILQLLAERGPLYQGAAHLIVDSSDRRPESVAGEIVRKVRGRAA